MPALGSGVQLRCIVQDQPSQLAAAGRLASHRVGEGSALVVPVAVVLDSERVPRSGCTFGMDDVLTALSSLSSAAEPTFDSACTVEVALPLLRAGSTAFADGLHVAQVTQAGEQPLWAFDQGALRVSGAQLPAGARVGHRVAAVPDPIRQVLRHGVL